MEAMSATASASTAKSSRARKSQHSQAVRQSQRHWVQLIEAWRSASAAADARDTLVDEIAHHAQTICREVKDKQWLVTAFQMAIHAVLLDDSEDAVEAKELSRREQLGQQLLQLATHSVTAPWLSRLKEQQHADARLIATAQETLQRLEQLSKRLSVFQRLHAQADKMALPVLPLQLVLEEPTNSVLVCIASIPQGAQMVAQLLKSCTWLVEESAPVRWTIAAQMLAAAPPSQEAYAALAKHGMLIAWKNGRETSAWQASASEATAVSLGDWTEFYAKALVTMRSDAEADKLLDVLARECEGQNVQDAIARLRSQLASKTSVAPPGKSRGQGTHAEGGKEMARFSLDAVKALSAQVSSAAHNTDATATVAQQLAAEHDVGAVSQRLTALIDSSDSGDTRAFAIEVIAHAARSGASAEWARVAAATLYARPAVGGFRLDLDAPTSLVEAAESVLAQLAGQTHVSTSLQSRLARTLRGALALDAQSVVPACQVLALVSTEDDAEVVGSMQMHVRWLRSIGALLGSTDGKPELDLCWLAAFGGDRRDTAGRVDDEAQTKQLAALEALMGAFGTANAPPSSLGGRPERAGADAGLLRFRAAWDAFFHSTLTLCGAESALALISRDKAMRLLLGQVLRTGDVDLFTSLSTGPNALGSNEREQLVLDVSSSLFDQATVASTRSKDVRLALGVLDALPASARAMAQREFIDAACRLGSFKVKSIRHAGGLLEPAEMRATTDKMDLVSRLIASQEGVHRSPELVLDLAHRLCSLDAVAGGKAMVEVRTLAMLADAATAAEDFDAATAFCQRLVDKAQRSRVGEAGVEVVWKSCLQLSKHPMWTDTAGRIGMLAHAMALCPPTQLSAMLRQWNALDQQLATEIDEGRAVAKKDGARAGINVGLVGTAANLLPLSFSPLSYFGGASTAGPKTTAREDGVDARTARLFDFDGVSGAAEGGSGYVDRAERAVNAARAARDFLGWKKSAPHDNTGTGGFAGFSLSRGVGWLIGDADKR